MACQTFKASKWTTIERSVLFATFFLINTYIIFHLPTGPEPLCDDSNVVVSFFALGDSPYDKNTNSCFNEQLNRFENPCSKNYGCNGGSGTQSETW